MKKRYVTKLKSENKLLFLIALTALHSNNIRGVCFLSVYVFSITITLQ